MHLRIPHIYILQHSSYFKNHELNCFKKGNTKVGTYDLEEGFLNIHLHTYNKPYKRIIL